LGNSDSSQRLDLMGSLEPSMDEFWLRFFFSDMYTNFLQRWIKELLLPIELSRAEVLSLCFFLTISGEEISATESLESWV
jgi:hypothetical protein